MHYDRFLEIHLVSSKMDAATTDVVGSGLHQYDFGSVGTRRRAYREKLQGAFDAAVPRMELLFNQLGGGAARAQGQQAHTRSLEHVLASSGTPIPARELEPMHYVNCYVDLESLRPGEPELPELRSLVEWVCAQQSASGGPTAGKMRLNCHGSNHDNAGFMMGQSSLSPDDFVDALVRHGLGTRAQQQMRRDLVSTKVRWKANDEVKACENCRKEFNKLYRHRHHCRRCGGIFCDSCSKQRRTLRNPLTEYGRESGEMANLRVCDACAAQSDEVSFKARGGLVQIALALCLTASSKTEFADAKTGFVRNSIAAMLVRGLSARGIHGIQVSGSNEVIAWTSGNYFKQTFEINYPGMGRANTTSTGPAVDPFEGTGWAGVVGEETTVTMPCSILGSRGEPNPKIQPILGNAAYSSIRDQKIVPVMGGNKLAFGVYTVGKADEKLVKEVLSKWKFHSWRMVEQQIARVPELTRLAGDLADGTVKEAETAFFSKSGLGSSPFQTAKVTALAAVNKPRTLSRMSRRWRKPVNGNTFTSWAGAILPAGGAIVRRFGRGPHRGPGVWSFSSGISARFPSSPIGAACQPTHGGQGGNLQGQERIPRGREGLHRA